MTFVMEKMLEHAVREISVFAKKHPNEHFYAFAISENLLCLNSEEAYAGSMENYRPIAEKRYQKNIKALQTADENSRIWREANIREYSTGELFLAFRSNPDNWRYHGFAKLTSEYGYDENSYDDHYVQLFGVKDPSVLKTSYSTAMTELIRRLNVRGAFDCLKRTDDFYANWW
ncbi:MAG: hypothetical protein AAFR74_05405 [Pseudomonadota bacterium]